MPPEKAMQVKSLVDLSVDALANHVDQCSQFTATRIIKGTKGEAKARGSPLQTAQKDVIDALFFGQDQPAFPNEANFFVCKPASVLYSTVDNLKALIFSSLTRELGVSVAEAIISTLGRALQDDKLGRWPGVSRFLKDKILMKELKSRWEDIERPAAESFISYLVTRGFLRVVGHPTLQCLDLKRSAPNLSVSEEWILLQDLSGMTSLRNLKIAGQHSRTAVFQSQLTGLKNLVSFETHSFCWDNFIMSLAQNCPELRRLVISWPSVGGEYFDIQKLTSGCSKLEEVNLEGTQVKSYYFYLLLHDLPQLKTLSGCVVNSEFMRLLQTCNKQFPRVTSFSCRMEGFPNLRDLVWALPKLTHLQISLYYFWNNASPLAKMQHLKKLTVRNVSIYESQLDQVLAAVGPGLTHLQLLDVVYLLDHLTIAKLASFNSLKKLVVTCMYNIVETPPLGLPPTMPGTSEDGTQPFSQLESFFYQSPSGQYDYDLPATVICHAKRLKYLSIRSPKCGKWLGPNLVKDWARQGIFKNMEEIVVSGHLEQSVVNQLLWSGACPRLRLLSGGDREVKEKKRHLKRAREENLDLTLKKVRVDDPDHGLPSYF